MLDKVARPIRPPEEIPGAVEVLELVKADLPGMFAGSSALIPDIAARIEYGRQKYGTVLKVPNGRPFLLDAYQELLDAVVYLRGALEENPGPAVEEIYLETINLAGLVRAILSAQGAEG